MMIGNYQIIRLEQLGDVNFAIGFNKNAVEPFGTWQSNGDDNYFFGHYFGDKDNANADFYKRISIYHRSKAELKKLKEEEER